MGSFDGSLDRQQQRLAEMQSNLARMDLKDADKLDRSTSSRSVPNIWRSNHTEHMRVQAYRLKLTGNLQFSVRQDDILPLN